jgi:hypothetical protein
MMVVNRDRAIFDRRYLSLLQLDDFLAIVNISGKEVYLDPGQKMCPFGSLHWKHNIASGFRLTEKDAVLATTPADTYKSNVVHRIADLKIDEQGNVTGTARIVMTGPDALYWRQLALQNDVEEVKKQFIESMRNSLPEGVQADFDHFTALDDGKHFFLPGLFFESRAKHPFVAQDKRVTPIDLHYAMMEQDDVIYHLPSGYTVDSVPHSSDVNWPDHALLQTSSTVKDSSVLVRRAFARSCSMLESADYNDLHDFYLKVAAADQQQLVLTNAAPAAGAKR